MKAKLKLTLSNKKKPFIEDDGLNPQRDEAESLIKGKKKRKKKKVKKDKKLDVISDENIHE
jgi:hypothetical protein